MAAGNDHSKSLDEEIYSRLKLKEKTMYDAIEADRLGSYACSSEEDIKEIFEKMGWKE